MSHFAVLVVSDDPSEETLGRILQPYHEYECTGIDDEYVVNVDVTEEYFDYYKKSVKRNIRLLDGSLHDYYADDFYREPTEEEMKDRGGLLGFGSFGTMGKTHYSSKDWGDGLGYRAKVHFMPEGSEEVEFPTSEFKTFLEYLADDSYEAFTQDQLDEMEEEPSYYALVDEIGALIRVVKRTNPNAKWDWWQIGGRYTGRFAPQYNPDEDPSNMEPCYLCSRTGRRIFNGEEISCNGCKGTGIAIKWPTNFRDVGNQCQVGDIPWDALRLDAEQKAAKYYDEFHAVVAGRDVPDWDELREQYPIDEAREKYNSHPVIRDLNKAEYYFWSDDKAILGDRDSYLKNARDNAISAFAFVHEGKWYEKGKMGWFACVSDEKDEDQWKTELNTVLDGLPKDKWLTFVDCHI